MMLAMETSAGGTAAALRTRWGSMSLEDDIRPDSLFSRFLHPARTRWPAAAASPGPQSSAAGEGRIPERLSRRLNALPVKPYERLLATVGAARSKVRGKGPSRHEPPPTLLLSCLGHILLFSF